RRGVHRHLGVSILSGAGVVRGCAPAAPLGQVYRTDLAADRDLLVLRRLAPAHPYEPGPRSDRSRVSRHTLRFSLPRLAATSVSDVRPEGGGKNPASAS